MIRTCHIALLEDDPLPVRAAAELSCGTCKRRDDVDSPICNACARAWNDSDYEMHPNWTHA